MFIKYSPNNSGGRWWLEDKDWDSLERSGWKVLWADLDFDYKDRNWTYDKDGLPKFKSGGRGIATKNDKGVWRYLGSKARYAFRAGLSLKDAVDEWEKVTNKDSTEVGCPCCGNPHSFTLYDDSGKVVDYGPSVDHSCSW